MATLLVLILVALIAGYFVLRSASAGKVSALRRIGVVTLLILAGVFLVRGQFLPALFFGLGAVAIGKAPLDKLFSKSGAARVAEHPDVSRVRTKWLDVTLNRRTGEVNGRILRGRFVGRPIGELSKESLIALRSECRGDDPQSVAILSAFITRLYEDAEAPEPERAKTEAPAAPSAFNMSCDEALDVLGLTSGASETEIGEAYRRLMMLVHPDRGGSDYLAAKINAAKAILLKKTSG